MTYVLQAAWTLRRFTENAFNDAMKAVMLGWSEEDIKIVGNNTLMLNYHTHAWNKTIQGKQAVQSGKRLCNMLLLYIIYTISSTTLVALNRNCFLMSIACTKPVLLIAKKSSEQRDSGDSNEVKEIQAAAMRSKPT